MSAESSASVRIERARAGDVPELVPLMRDFNRDEGIAWQPEAMPAALARLVDSPALGFVLLARRAEDASLIGYSIATWGFDIEFAGPDAFVTELYVSPGCRGRGFGRRLLSAMIDALTGQGACAVHLMVRPQNAVARALYRSLGFQDVPRILMTRPLNRSD